MKEAGHKCDLLVIFEKPFEEAVCEVIEDGKVWSLTGVLYSDDASEEVKAEMISLLKVQMSLTLVFNDYDAMNTMIGRVANRLITHLEEPTNADGSVPTTFYKQVPLIAGDTIEMSSVIQQFEAFKSIILTAVE